MHFISLVTVEIPEIKEDQKKNQQILQELQRLKEIRKQNPGNIALEIAAEKTAGLTTEFARQVDYEVGEIMRPYNECTEDLNYLEFDDRTNELREDYYNGKPDCIKMPNGAILEANSYPLWNKFVISDGKVYQKYAGSLRHMKRTKKAKKMKALPAYPRTKLFKSFEDYAEQFCIPYDEQNVRYGYWFNPNAMWDWYSIGGRWADTFLVKDTCIEFSIGERSWCNSDEEFKAPEGYMWVCAARKKDIDWQKMREWDTQKAVESYEKLQRMFSVGKLEDGFYGQIDDEGIFSYGTYIYRKSEFINSYLQREALPAEWRYPMLVHDIVNADDWQSEDDIIIGDERQKLWHTNVDHYIDSISDDTVLVGVDCHI